MTTKTTSRNFASNKSSRFIGVGLVLVSALVFSSAGLFVKGVEADAWSIIFWRGIFAIAFTTGYIAWRGKLKTEFVEMGKIGWIAGFVAASGSVAFIPAFKFTSIANVTLIYAAAPLVAAFMMWLWVRERPTLIVTVSSIAAFFGVLVIVSGSMGGSNLKGDLLALWMTLIMSLYICIYRRYPDTPGAGPMVLSSIILLPVCLIFAPQLTGPLHEILIMGGFGLVFAIASVTLVEGARRLPAGETALLSAIETPLAPVWAYLLFSEVPVLLTLIGGSIVFIAVLASQFLPTLMGRFKTATV